MNYCKNEKGMTLMELLAAIVIFALFAGIIWGFFFQSYSFNDVEVTKQKLQQEANVIINAIQNVHTREESYSISTNSTQSNLSISGQTFERPGIKYEIQKFEPSENWKDVHVVIKLSSVKEPDLNYEINTTFTRIR